MYSLLELLFEANKGRWTPANIGGGSRRNEAGGYNFTFDVFSE